ncbi:hypothetical protein Cgig2_011982 [Carnegiea gigantea]|uniref:Uncharacterized protein n=1 Tax=Carnegiea gigantea TaxID=171969 RepID=A0A9Q1GMM5_9CARY|nr:hypothetical protein Cgig2_011982 [Carnegiea gigantea]
MGFPRSLATDEMALYALGNFEWYRREVVFPPRPLPCDYEELCSDFALAMVEEYARDYDVPELPQVFLAMLLNDAMKLSVLRGWMIGVMELALKELRCSVFQAWVAHNRASSGSEEEDSSGSDDQTSLCSDRSEEESRFTIFTMAFLPFRDTEEMADHVRETFRWHWRSASRPPCPLPKDYQDLCPHFTLSDAEEATRDFELLEIVQATSYAMLLNDAVGLGIVSGFMAAHLKATLEGLRSRERKRERNSAMFPNFNSTEQAVEYVRENFLWSLRKSLNI